MEKLWWLFWLVWAVLGVACLWHWLGEQDSYTYWRDIDAVYQFEGGGTK